MGNEMTDKPNMTHDAFARAVDEQLAEIGRMLKRKNRAYGNSALEPLRVFSKADTVEQIKVRLDDKLSRLINGRAVDAPVEDTVADLIGYFVLLRIAERPHADSVDGSAGAWFAAQAASAEQARRAGVTVEEAADGATEPKKEAAE